MAREMCQESSSHFDPKQRCHNEHYKGCGSTSSIAVRKQKEKVSSGVGKFLILMIRCVGFYDGSSVFTLK